MRGWIRIKVGRTSREWESGLGVWEGRRVLEVIGGLEYDVV